MIGFWCLVPLIAIAASATVFHYDWATDANRPVPACAVGRSADPPRRRRPQRLDIDTLISDARLRR